MAEPKRLYRSRSDRVLAGVCGGVAAYFVVDPVLVRVVWIVVSLFFGTGILAYLVLWLVVPEAPVAAAPPAAPPAGPPGP